MSPAELIIRCRVSESCLPDALYRKKLTKLHDDMMSEIETLRMWIREQGQQTDTCTFNILREKCEYCQCHRSKA